MNDSEMLVALVALAKSHPYVAAALGLWLVLSLGWKAQPKEKREAWGKTYPRPVSALRFLLEILPDLLGAGRVLVYGMIRGQASREIVAPERETQAPPPPRESEPGYVESRALAVIALASLVALVAFMIGCSAREQLRRSVEPLGLYEVQHPLHGGCHEVGVRAQSHTLNRELVVYGGVCVGTIDAGAAGDAGGE